MRTIVTSVLASLAGLFFWLLAAVPAGAASSLPIDTGKVVARLISDHHTVRPGQTFQIALETTLDEKWHTYWRNPGDSGEPVQIQWSLPESLSAGEIVWPIPDAIPTGPFINYGFEGVPLFPVAFTVSETAEPGSILEVTADVYYLVCKDICIPEDGQLRLVLSVGEMSEVNVANSAAIQGALSAAPRPASDVRGAVQKMDEALILEFERLPEGDYSNAYFYPYADSLLDHSAPQEVMHAEGGALALKTKAGFGWAESGVTELQTGLLTFSQNGQKTGRIVTAAPGQSLGVVNTATGGGVAAPKGGSVSEIGLLGALIGALLGGLILNLMPCVFPVISLKALSLAKSAHAERAVARREAWAYAAGVFATFLALVAVLLIIKASGAALGWGFQLQNPVVVGLLALLLFAVGLNLIGAFEIAGGAYQGTGANLAGRGGLTGSFFTGALAVLVATPCTAPFMAGAIGYALAQPAFITLAVFAALALGFAAPFVLLAYAPGLLQKLPKPGPWMVRLKEIMAFPMFAAAVWLIWVVGNQAGADGMTVLLLAMVMIGLAIWLGQRGGIWRVAAALLVVGAILFPALTLKSGSAKAATTLSADQAWSPERVAELRADGRAVFVDFTADWCVTCKVNERVVLKTDAVQAAFAETNTAFLIADWTNKNDLIAQELERYGRAGVPLYLYFPPAQPGEIDNSVSATVLPQILTTDMVVSTLRGS